METIAIEGIKRTDIGKKATKAVRSEGLIPCVVYGGEDCVHFTVTQKAVKGLIYTPNFYKAGITVDGKTYEAIIKDIQFHPVTDAILHIDFLKLIPGAVVKTEIPVRTTGVASGVKEGGKLMMKIRKLKVKSTPEQLQDVITIDVSNLALGQSFKVRDIVDTGMEIMVSPAIPIASVEVPRTLRAGDVDDLAGGNADATEEAATEEEAAPAE